MLLCSMTSGRPESRAQAGFGPGHARAGHGCQKTQVGHYGPLIGKKKDFSAV